MNKKVLLVTMTLIAVVMTATPLIGAVQAGYGGKNKATFEWYVVQWPLGRVGSEDTRTKIIEKKDGQMIISHDVYTYGEPPVPEVIIVPPPPFPLVINPTWDEYPNGGIRLTVTPEGEDPYTLVGSFEKTMLYIGFNPRGGILENSKWSFIITDVESGDAPDGAVGSTMYGTIKNSLKLVSVMEIKSTKGTGIFEGAFLRGTHTTFPGVVPNPSPPPLYTLLSTSEGSGEIVFP